MDLTYGIIPPPDLKCLNNDIERQSESIGMWGIGRLLLYITDNIEALSMDLSASLNCIAKGNAATLAATIRNAGIAVRENKSLIPALQRMAGVAAIELGSLVPVGTGHRIGELAAAAARWTDLSDIAFANELIDERDNLRKLIKCLDDFVNDARAAAEPVFPIEDAIFERQAKAAERVKAGEEGPTEVAEQAAVVVGLSETLERFEAGVKHATRVFESLEARDSDHSPAAKSAKLKRWAMEAWQARQVGQTVTAIAATLAKKYNDPKITQPRVTEQIQLAEVKTKASGLAEIAARVLPNGGTRAPARTLDPAVADLGQRTDGRSKHLRDKASQMAKEE